VTQSRAAAVSVLTLAVAGAWVSCSGKTSINRPDAAAGSGGSGAGEVGASGGNGGTGGTTPLTGESGGIGGAVDAGSWGQAPDWEPTNMVAAGCKIDRLVNAPEVRFFKWEACSWSPGNCERAVFNTDLVSAGPDFVGAASSVYDDGAGVRVGLKFDSANYESLFATGDGIGLVGVRAAQPGCELDSSSVRGNRFAVRVARNLSQTSSAHGAVLGDVTGPNKSQLGVTFTNAPSFGIAQLDALGTSRWLWWYATYGYSTVSALDGSGFTMFVRMGGPLDIVYLGWPTTTGDLFLFDAFTADDAGAAHGKILYSDGIAAPQIYLQPTEPDTYYGAPAYANDYVAFFKGIGFQNVNQYSSVEVWATPYSPDPSQLAPVKIGDDPLNSFPTPPTGGWGYVAFNGLTLQDALHVWNLATATEHVYGMPTSYNLISLIGITRTHVWVGAGAGGQMPDLIRIRLP
jgi:hypothetical protein